MRNNKLLVARIFWWIDYIMQMLAYLFVLLAMTLVFALTLLQLAKSIGSGVTRAATLIGIMMKVFIIVWTYLYLKFLITRPNYPKGEFK